MLPNHSPLVVAEQFGMLEALHPGRIDLGLGRAPGHRRAHRRRPAAQHATISGDDFPRQLGRAARLLPDDSLPDGPPVRQRSTPCPARGYQPATSGCSAAATSARMLAGQLGLPFSFAHHFAGDNTDGRGRRLPQRVPAVGPCSSART